MVIGEVVAGAVPRGCLSGCRRRRLRWFEASDRRAAGVVPHHWRIRCAGSAPRTTVRNNEQQAGDPASVWALRREGFGGEVPVFVVDRQQAGFGKFVEGVEPELDRANTSRKTDDLEEAAPC